MTELYTRPVSAFPVSIGTSLALESIFTGTNPPYDPERKIPNKIKLSDYTEAWFNLEVLIRNIATSVERVRYLDCTPDHVLEILLTEIEIITSLFQTEGNSSCKPVFYCCSYKALKASHHGRVEFRESSTIIQKSYDLKAETVIKKLLKQTDSILEFDSELKREHRPSILIMTHYPFDLTSHNHFKRMDLLESHTGILKTKNQWNTKYAPFGQESLYHLPFLRELLFVFGDKTQISPQNRKIRQTVYDISIKEKWTPFSTSEKIRNSYRANVMHPADLQILMSF